MTRLAARLQSPARRGQAMGKRDREKKQMERLRLRREVIRLLADESLNKVVGGYGSSCQSACYPSKGEP